MAEHGVRGVAVEGLAATLGVTKSSFYGYFANRDELIAAVLELWESEFEAHLMVPLRHVTDPARRFELMAASTLLKQRRAPITRGDALVAEISAVELSLMNDRHRQDVADTLARVVSIRVDFLAECLRQIGHQPDTARQLAISACTLSLGTEVLRRNALLIANTINDDYVTTIIRSYLSPQS